MKYELGKDAHSRVKKSFFFFILFLGLLLPGLAQSEEAVPILLYHRFGPTVADSMTTTVAVFESQLKYLKDNGYTVIPLRQLVDHYLNKSASAPLPRKPVVIVADDGHKSVYTYMLPLIKKYRFPVTLFLYPSAISNASYAMTWDEVKYLKGTGLFDIQGHTYWHPNFKIEKKRLSHVEYDRFVDMQLNKSKSKLEKELGCRITMLAWPFGIYDDELEKKAAGAGYTAAFSIERRPAAPSDKMMALPRFLMTNRDNGKAFAAILKGVSP